MIKPFDDLNTVTELIRLRKLGHSYRDLAFYFNTSKHNISKTLTIHKVSTLGVPKSHVRHLIGNYEDVKRRQDTVTIGTGGGKYDLIFDEKINEGKNYAEYCEQYGIKVVNVSANGGFEKIKNFDIRNIGLKKMDFVRRKSRPVKNGKVV